MSVVKDEKTGKYYIGYRYTDFNGKSRTSTRRGFETKEQAEEFANYMKLISRNKISVSHLTFKEFVKIYLDYVKVNYKQDTYYNYKLRLETYAVPFLGKYLLVDINNLVYSKFKVYLSKVNKVKTSNYLTDSYKNTILYTLKGLFTFAKNEYFYKVPCYDFVTIFKNRDIKEPINILNKDEVLSLVSIIDQEIYIKGLILLFFFTGCRSAEGRGLQWKYVNFKNNTIRIEQIVKTKGNKKGVKFRFETPKNSNSKKIIPMHKELLKVIKEIYLIDSNKKGFNLEKFVFGYNNPIPDTTFRTKLYKYLNQKGFPHVTPHGLKHSCITYLASAGVPISDIAYFVGETIEVLQRVYIQAFTGYKDRVLKAFD